MVAGSVIFRDRLLKQILQIHNPALASCSIPLKETFKLEFLLKDFSVLQ